MATMSRGDVWVGLRPRHWVVLFQQLEPSDGPVYYHRKITVQLQYQLDAAALGIAATGGAGVRIKIQDSPTGVVWTDRYVHPVNLQPGGEVIFSYWHVQPHVRCVLYSTQGGRVNGEWLKTEDQTLPHLLPDEHIALTCSTLCEVDCETGNETVG